MNIRARQDALVRHLRRSGHTNIDSLARAVGASRRTVLRDVVALRDQGFVIHAEAGRGGGLFLDPSSVQLTPRLTADEVFA
ncbi:MAG: HTH domain-containing protein, partial [Rhodospirillales bacterium]